MVEIVKGCKFIVEVNGRKYYVDGSKVVCSNLNNTIVRMSRKETLALIHEVLRLRNEVDELNEAFLDILHSKETT